MTIFKYKSQAIIIFMLSVTLFCTVSCGVKSNPIPKDTLKIPFPTKVSLELQDGGVLIINDEDNSTVLVEKAEQDGGVFTNNSYRRISMVPPQSSYLDDQVKTGTIYTYRFKNYNQRYNTYSIGVTRAIKYSPPVKLGEVTIDEYIHSACVSAKLTSVTEYASIFVNGKESGRLEKDDSVCFDMPNSLVVTLMIIPYDNNGNAGVPYESTFKRDENVVLLPPQNIKVLRSANRVILTWDKADNINEVAIYLNEKGGVKLLEKTEITLYQHNLKKGDQCVDFELSSIRDLTESDRVKVTSCP